MGFPSVAICNDYNVIKRAKKGIWIPKVYPKLFFSLQNTEINEFLFQVVFVLFSKREEITETCKFVYAYQKMLHLKYFEQGVPWHSDNYRVWIHFETRTWYDKNIQSNAPYR